MGSSELPNIVERVQSSTEDSDEKSRVKFDEKAQDIEVVEIQTSSQRRPPLEYLQSCVQSFLGAFTKQKFLYYAAVMVKFGKFMGPGTIISVAYIDPDNYQTAVSAGAEFQYKLLFMVLLSNLIAIYLQVSHQVLEIGCKCLTSEFSHWQSNWAQ
jgi:metal iron transporter